MSTSIDDQVAAVTKQYDEERNKRLREDGITQYIDPSRSERFQHFQEDPWVDPSTIDDAGTKFPNNTCKILIIGAGWGGLLYAIRMVEAGIPQEDIRIIDSAGGFGGTWYWNRYPGLMCDIESYVYLPLLEQTGYIPKHRYSYGEEIRRYINLVAQKWQLMESAVFQTVASVTGVLNGPKLPGIPGILDFKGDIFHSARFAYRLTGGSPEDPSLWRLQDKRVAIIGTGATGVQLVPQLAQWAKHLYVVQRTPSAVDYRGQKETDIKWFRESVAKISGWQEERAKNFHEHFTIDEPPGINLVDDEWTRAPGLVGMAGNRNGPKSMEQVPGYMNQLAEVDLPRQERIRSRVDQEVTDSAVAAKLKPWYPSWCKRPCFHDEYLKAFNRDNVTLVDTDGKGLRCISADSIIAGETSYPVDLIILATGYKAPAEGSPAERAGMSIIGRNGVSMSEEWAQNGPATVHGILDQRFPNLFLCGPSQSSISGSFTYVLDELAKHCAYIVAEAERRADGKPCAIAATAEGSEPWGQQILMRALPLTAVAGCTPGYYNLEGGMARLPPEKQLALARGAPWGSDIGEFTQVLDAWRAEGGLCGMEVDLRG
ncbi:hypothetical protein BJX96DRAFT_180960 [Aspergillus floccosus]